MEKNILKIRFLRMIKLSCLFLICSMGFSFASHSYAQETVISLNIINQTVADVLDDIEAQTDFQFFYNSKLIDTNRRVSVDVKNVDCFCCTEADIWKYECYL